MIRTRRTMIFGLLAAAAAFATGARPWAAEAGELVAGGQARSACSKSGCGCRGFDGYGRFCNNCGHSTAYHCSAHH